jgi:hypothetical protein
MQFICNEGNLDHDLIAKTYGLLITKVNLGEALKLSYTTKLIWTQQLPLSSNNLQH